MPSSAFSPSVVRPFVLLALASPVVCSTLAAANLTGDGYINLTGTGVTWAPPTNSDHAYDDISRFFFYPAKSAFRFGMVSSVANTVWSSANIGLYSFAGGLSSTASGEASFAFGEYTTVSGSYSHAIGSWAMASADYSNVIGTESYATGWGSSVFGNGGSAMGSGSVAIGSASAAGANSLAFGMSAYAEGDFSLAVSTVDPAWASGDSSMAIGNLATTQGQSSVAFGQEANALADFSAALGPYAYTSSQNSVALGNLTVSKRMNGSLAVPSTPMPDDPVLMVSPGPTDWNQPTRNALTIYRNNAAHFAGVVRVKAGGDIPMGTYTAKPSGVSYP